MAHQKQCAINLAKTSGGNEDVPSQLAASRVTGQDRSKIDNSVLALSEPKRLRSKERLRFVARQACLTCGRTTSHASLPEVVTEGDSEEEALANAEEAVRAVLEYRQGHGLSIPSDTYPEVRRVTVAA